MDKKEEFKNFIKQNPSLVRHIKNGNMTFQKYYEIYDIYGEEKEAWKNYLEEEKKTEELAAGTGFMAWLKSLDLDSIQNSVQSVQRVLSVLGDFTTENSTKKEEYKPRPTYKHFED